MLRNNWYRLDWVGLYKRGLRSSFRLFFHLGGLGRLRLSTETGKSVADAKLEAVHGTLNRVKSRADVQVEDGHVVGNIVLAAVVVDHIAHLLAASVNDPVMAIERLWCTVELSIR